MTLFVAGLPYDLDDAELLEIFEKFGPVLSAKVSMDRETGKSRGFGFVKMEKAEDGREAIELLNEISLGKKPLVVKEAEERSTPLSIKVSDQVATTAAAIDLLSATFPSLLTGLKFSPAMHITISV